jgi:hypothetical protein
MTEKPGTRRYRSQLVTLFLIVIVIKFSVNGEVQVVSLCNQTSPIQNEKTRKQRLTSEQHHKQKRASVGMAYPYSMLLSIRKIIEAIDAPAISNGAVCVDRS